MRVRPKHLRLAASIAAALVFVPVLGQWFIALADEMGLYKQPAERARAVIGFILGSPWFHWSGGAVLGFTAGVWLDVLIRKRERPSRLQAPGPVGLKASAAPASPPTSTLAASRQTANASWKAPPISTGQMSSLFAGNDDPDFEPSSSPHLWLEKVSCSVSVGSHNKKTAQSFINVVNKTASDLKGCRIYIISFETEETIRSIDAIMLIAAEARDEFTIQAGQRRVCPFIRREVNVVPEQRYRLPARSENRLLDGGVVEFDDSARCSVNLLLDAGQGTLTLAKAEGRLGPDEKLMLTVGQQVVVRKRKIN